MVSAEFDRQRPAEESSLLSDINRVFGVEVDFVDRECLSELFETLAPVLRIELQRRCERHLRDFGSPRADSVRVALVRVLVLLLPDSLSVIEEWLAKKAGLSYFEFHFTLFCYLDWVWDLNPEPSITSEILGLVESYLSNAKRNTAMATWMAGHLLEGHWPSEEAVPVLMRLARNATYVEGRRSAIGSLECVLNDSAISRKVRKEIRVVLKACRRDDRSRVIREYVRV